MIEKFWVYLSSQSQSNKETIQARQKRGNTLPAMGIATKLLFELYIMSYIQLEEKQKKKKN